MSADIRSVLSDDDSVASLDIAHGAQLGLIQISNKSDRSAPIPDDTTSTNEDACMRSSASEHDESEMSEDGGVQLSVTSSHGGLHEGSHASAMNAEMDLLDAEVMGMDDLDNLAAITTAEHIQTLLDELEVQQEEEFFHHEEGATHAPPFEWFTDGMLDDGDGLVEPGTVLAPAAENPSPHITYATGGLNQDIAVGLGPGHEDPFHIMEEQFNLSLGDFLYSWSALNLQPDPYSPKRRKRVPHLGAIAELRQDKPSQVTASDLQGEKGDYQGIDWVKLGVTRAEARRARHNTYRCYVNLQAPDHHKETLYRSRIDGSQSYFKFHQIDLKQKLHYSHFQLRNLVACTSRNRVYYAGITRVYRANPTFNQTFVQMDLSDSPVQSVYFNGLNGFNGVVISTLAADHNMLITGGFGGEYGIQALDAESSSHTEGLLTDDINPITNHIDINLNRSGGRAEAVFASNDSNLRVLDCMTDRIVSKRKFDYAINCTDLSADGRLRVAVGDTQNVLILNAETGEILQELDGHLDYGFACAWADNGWHVATGAQDKLVKIWDARMWTDTNGHGRPLKTISSSMASVRSLAFSPVGSGKRVLVAAEQADVVSIIDAETYSTKQAFDFFGEILGASFSPDGQSLHIGIHDSTRGGLMELRRCGAGETYCHRRERYSTSAGAYRVKPKDQDTAYDAMAAGLDWRPSTAEAVSHSKAMRTESWHRRKAGRLSSLAFHH